MNAAILSQGLSTDTDKSVGTTLIKLLADGDFHTFTGISAFASVAGVAILAPYVEAAKQKSKELRLIVGVDQQATSKEALEAIMALGIKAYVFYQTNYSIFHPKMYMFEGDHTAQLIIGSSNLTQQGLFISVEGSTHLELSLGQEADDKVLSDLKNQFLGLYDLTDPNLQPITQELIDRLVAEKVVPTEAERKKKEANAKEAAEESVEEEEPAEERAIPKLFPKRALPKVPAEYKPKKAVVKSAARSSVATKKSAATMPASAASNPTASVPASYTLMWEMAKVPGSSVQTTNSPRTNPTGMMRLVQAGYHAPGEAEPIASATYFRDVVFKDLLWAVDTPKTIIATANFEVSTPSGTLGTHPLVVRHKPSGVASQGNYTTGISWSTLGNAIRDADLAGKTVRLLKKDGTDDTFKLEFS